MYDELVCDLQRCPTGSSKCRSHTDQICLLRSKITQQWLSPLWLWNVSCLPDRRSWQQQHEVELVMVLNGGLGGSGWLTGKRKGSAREHCQGKVYFSRRDRYWLPTPFLPCDSYVMFIKLARRLYQIWAGAMWWKLAVHLCGNYLQQALPMRHRNKCTQTDTLNNLKQKWEVDLSLLKGK